MAVTDTLLSNVAFFNASGGCRLVSGMITCSMPGTLAPGASVTVLIAVKPIATGQIHNTASVSGNQTDPNPSNNTATAVTGNAAIFADLGMTLTASPVSVRVEQRITYTVTVTNNGPMTAPDVTVVEGGFAPGNNFVSASSSRGTCTGTVVVTCELGALANGARATERIVRTPTGITGSVVAEQEFQQFLNLEITPRFPDGLTLLVGLGQFRDSSRVILRERSMLL